MSLRPAIITLALTLLGACSAPTAPATFTETHAVAKAATASDDNCSFSRGTTTCVSSVQSVETATHTEYSGCLYGPNGVPGARTRTFSDTYLVTTTTTTLSRGQFGPVYDSSTAVTNRVPTGSTLISDVCSPI
ncbi:MAG: hypothetical protein QOK07_3101 [Gemmatimonadaceae bacterium]|nr:hypothetical protein [Gemmatimonadaceae bacterium]